MIADARARNILHRLSVIDDACPVNDPCVEAALAEHFRRLSLEPPPVRWVADAKAGYQYVFEKADSASAWRAACAAAGSAARRAAKSAMESAAGDAAWNDTWVAVAAMSVATNGAWDEVRNAAGGVARSPAGSAARSAIGSAAGAAAWSAVCGATGGASPAVEHWIDIWLPFVDAAEAGLWLFFVTQDEVVAVPRPPKPVVPAALR